MSLDEILDLNELLAVRAENERRAERFAESRRKK